MAKKIVDYREQVGKVVKAFEESRVLLVGKGKGGNANVMAIGWGAIGIFWRKPVFAIVVRPTRHTYDLIEETKEFTVNIVPPELKEVVQFCGSVSGREHNKFKEKNLTTIPSTKVKPPLIKEGILHFECKVIHKNDLDPEGMAESLVSQFYPKRDFHHMYFGEILACHEEV